MTKPKTEPRGDDATIQAVAAEVGEFLEKQDALAPEATAPAPILVKKRKKKKKWLKWVIFAVVVAGGLTAWKLIPREDPSKMTEQYKTEVLAKGDLTVKLNGTGTIEPAASYSINALVSGEVLEAPFEEGQIVEKGALLYRFDSSDVKTSIERAELSLARAKESHERLLDTAKDYVITAPITGTITKLSIEKGDSVGSGTAVATISDRSVATLKVPFFSEDAAVIRPGMTARVTLSDSLETIAGTVDVVSAMEEVGAGGALTRQVTIKVKNPRGISTSTFATATVNGLECNRGASFTFPDEKTVTAKAAGDIEVVKYKEGDTIAKGATLATIDNEKLDEQLSDSKKSVTDAELSLQNTRDQLENYEITAPISGTVIEKNLKAGDTLDSNKSGSSSASGSSSSSSSAIAIIYDLSHLEFTLSIDELDVSTVKVGQNVTVTADSVPGKTFTGKVSKVSVNGTTSNGATAYPVTVVLDQAEGLLPGMNVSADILITEKKDILTVPAEAVARGNTVLVTKDSPSAKNGEPLPEHPEYVRIPVQLGLSDDSRVEITSGLQVGDTIAYIETTFENTKNQFTGMGMGGGEGGGGGGRPAEGGTRSENVQTHRMG